MNDKRIWPELDQVAGFERVGNGRQPRADEFEKGMHAWQDGRGVTDPNERGRVERNLPTLRAYIWPRIAWNARL